MPSTFFFHGLTPFFTLFLPIFFIFLLFFPSKVDFLIGLHSGHIVLRQSAIFSTFQLSRTWIQRLWFAVKLLFSNHFLCFFPLLAQYYRMKSLTRHILRLKIFFVTLKACDLKRVCMAGSLISVLVNFQGSALKSKSQFLEIIKIICQQFFCKLEMGKWAGPA